MKILCLPSPPFDSAPQCQSPEDTSCINEQESKVRRGRNEEEEVVAYPDRQGTGGPMGGGGWIKAAYLSKVSQIKELIVSLSQTECISHETMTKSSYDLHHRTTYIIFLTRTTTKAARPLDELTGSTITPAVFTFNHQPVLHP